MHLLQALLMSSSLKCSGEERIEDFRCSLRIHRASTQAEHIRIIMLSREFRIFHRCTACSADAGDFIAHHAFPKAATPEKDARDFLREHHACNFLPEGRI